jgi:dTDP-4-amino-4,6-dideoxygalactose transaminase
LRVPLVDLRAQYHQHRAAIDAALAAVIDESAYIKGPYVARFEREFAESCGVRHCIGVANGTDAIYVVLKCLGLGPGDEVITPAMTWISTSEAVTQTGATPVFVDVEPGYYTMDPSRVEAKLTPRTRALLPVHLYGQMADLGPLEELCRRHGLLLVEDCAQAHLAALHGRTAGTVGVAGTFSFYPGKNLGAYGDAGAIVTNDDELADRLRKFSNHGALVKHSHEIEGVNSRLDGIQAAVLSAKLPHLLEWNDRRRSAARQYSEELADLTDITLPLVRPGSTHVFHLFVILTPDRDGLRSFLREQSIETGIHYPTAVPYLRAYARFGHTPADFPVAYSYQNRLLSLPLYPEMPEADVREVGQLIRRWILREPRA